MGKIFEMFWDCPYCNTKGIGGSKRNCPGCGRPRDNSITFYRDENNMHYLSDAETSSFDRRPDWNCSYCNSYNKASVTICPSCGHSRDESDKNYFAHQENLKRNFEDNDVTTGEDVNEDVEGKNNSSLKNSYNDDYYGDRINHNKECDYSNYSSSSNTSTFAETSSKEKSNTSSNKISNIFSSVKKFFNDLERKDFLTYGIIAVIVIGIIIAVTCAFIPKEKDATLTAYSWERTINYEHLVTCNENDWTLPSEARLLYTQNEIKYYEQVLDHYEEETYTDYQSVIVGYETETHYVDLGNGYGEEYTTETPIYESQPVTKTRSVPVYRDEPVYATKYYYEIDRWLNFLTQKSAGEDKEPYWNEYECKELERESDRSEAFYFTFIDEKGKEISTEVDSNTFYTYEIGSKATVTYNLYGTFLKYKMK